MERPNGSSHAGFIPPPGGSGSGSSDSSLAGFADGMPPPPKGGAPPPPPMLSPDFGDVLISKEIYDVVETVINVYIINILSVVGSVGNIISIIILSIDGFKNSANIILLSMAVADLLIVLTIPLRKISMIIANFDTATSITVESYVVSCHLLTLNRVWSLISNSHATLVAMERLVAVYFPFQVSRWLTGRRITVIVVLTHVIWYLALIPLFTMFNLDWIFVPSLNATVAFPAITSFYMEREEFFNDYNSYFINIFVGALLLLVTLVCCIAVAVKIVKMGKKRKLMSSNMNNFRSKTERENSTHSISKDLRHTIKTQSSISSTIQASSEQTVGSNSSSRSSSRFTKSAQSRVDLKVVKMLMTVCVAFFILIFPSFLLAFFQGLYPQLRKPYWHRVNFMATSFSMLLITINSSINFIIYVILSQRFHNIFLKTCCKMCLKK